MNDNRRDDLWDQLTDAALREALGGKQPSGHTTQRGGHTTQRGGHTTQRGGHTAQRGGNNAKPGGHTTQRGDMAPPGDVTPASRTESRGAVAGKGKRSASAERAGWMLPWSKRGRTVLKVLVASTCGLAVLALVVVINNAASDRPWFRLVAKSEAPQSANDLRSWPTS